MATATERPSTHASAPASLLRVLVILFFLSGLCGLVYQVLWSRLLALVFGVTVYAVSATLASFMSGLALGSYAAGRLVDRARNPLLWYGVAEVLIGLSALATPWALGRIETLYADLYPSLADSFGALTLVRFALSFLVLMVPTTLMGATLPIIIKSSLLRTGRLAESLSVLYATNTAGAIFGTLLTGYYLIGGIGMLASFRLAAALNVFVGIVAWAAALKYQPALQTAPIAPDASFVEDLSVIEDRREDAAGAGDVVSPSISTQTGNLILVVFMLSGFISFALEVVWFRVLSVSMGGSIYAFVVMLAAFLGGISLGSYAITPLMKKRWNWLATLAVTQLAIAVVSLLSLTLMAKVYQVLVAQDRWTRAAAFVAILPTALLMGAAFPVGLRLYAGTATANRVGNHTGHDNVGHDSVGRDVGHRVGVFYSLNVFGSILGSVAGGFFLLPMLGSRASFITLAALNLACGLALLICLPTKQRARHWQTGAAALALFLFAAFSLPRLSELILTSQHRGATLLYQEEGVQTTATLQRNSDGELKLYLDASHQAGDSDGMVADHRRIAHLAMMLHTDPKDVLVIGLGGGVTPGAASLHPQATVDIVELSETVVRASEWFRHVNHDVLRRPNARLRVDDGRNYLRLTDKRYDVLTADIIYPTQAGAGNLYSAEYFRLCREALKEDGLMLQWVSQRSKEEYKLILRTFLNAFPHTTLWARGALIVGTKKPLAIDRTAFERRAQEPVVREALAEVGIRDFQALLRLYRAGDEEMREFLGPDGAMLTDDRPLAEYYLSLTSDGEPFDLSGLRRGDVLKHVRQ